MSVRDDRDSKERARGSTRDERKREREKESQVTRHKDGLMVYCVRGRGRVYTRTWVVC